MSEIFRTTLEKLPVLFTQNAKGMMVRMVAHMQQQMEGNGNLSNASYLSLLLRMSSADLALEFDKSVRSAMAGIKDSNETLSGGLSLELDMAGDGQADFSMQESEKAFQTLQSKAQAVGASRLKPFSTKSFLHCVKEAMTNARIGDADALALTPFARRALNRELFTIYQKLNDL